MCCVCTDVDETGRVDGDSEGFVLCFETVEGRSGAEWTANPVFDDRNNLGKVGYELRFCLGVELTGAMV